ncbi:YdeI/OmpD-associated family protein [Pedobacter xixiisoli]|uniref:Uncharacterized conserved protein YdeI, YjbR/CyaY-like superfamily, DUF1801 family n=1 Tax=Pedobacter xixiisoli TaxID=1476464 RepID=A0A286ACY4_9SPHI|nr:YdeI/OmpD-associated family protein [Pedobacter xixiisoli]SOD19763.1 Uncharacterized conserved protein YdeI, YjbR/CyaY-like superfamily, DUF1801 family [Pedobacter xixiisoli]
MKEDIPTISPKNQQEWRQWLIENHASEEAVWLLAYKKSANKETIAWSETVDEALCFGWIDGMRKSIDDESFVQFLCKRKPKSGWSKINKEKIERLIADGLMTEAGLKSIEIAKQNGSWTLLDEVEELTISPDLEAAFARNIGSKDFFLSLSKSVRKMILQWIAFAKKTETREKRITEVAELAAKKQKPKQF